MENNQKRKTLTLIRGLPGSGKSTYAKNHFNCLILENDMFHFRNGKYMWEKETMPVAIRWCKDMCRHALMLGMDVVVSNTFTKRSVVDEYREIAEHCGANFNVIRCTGNFKNIHSVPQFVLESMTRGFEDWEGETVV